MASCSWLRIAIAILQFAPKLGEVHANIAKERELCRGLTPRSVDLVCFPEMIFTGYMFPGVPWIAPYLEHPKTAPAVSFCAELARRLEWFVVAGFPEGLVSKSYPLYDHALWLQLGHVGTPSRRRQLERSRRMTPLGTSTRIINPLSDRPHLGASRVRVPRARTSPAPAPVPAVERRWPCRCQCKWSAHRGSDLKLSKRDGGRDVDVHRRRAVRGSGVL
ncbi:hypothetical protein OG21DRAFT_1507542 [Imleria badia]|nr:hypothetical protein OG21DRAFT_1507542 [Imleria badia]